jgi:hypothetical protein
MTIQVLVVSLLAMTAGLAIAFAGLRLFLVLLPVWGLVTGFIAGAGAVTLLAGDGFLATILGWGAGIVVGLLFALLSYLYWYGVVLVTGGAIGYLLGVGIMSLLGIGGVLAFLVGAALAAVLAIAVAVVDLPRYLVIAGSGVAGAATAVAGVMLLVGNVGLAALGEGPIAVVNGAGPLGWIAWVVLAIAGIASQVQTTRSMEVQLRTEFQRRHGAGGVA